MYSYAPQHKVTRALELVAKRFVDLTGGLNGRT